MTVDITFGILFVAIIVWLLCKAIFSAYFTAREDHFDRLVSKQKRHGNGKAE